MKTKKIRRTNRITDKKTKKYNNPIISLSNFLSTLKTSKNQKCNISEKCDSPNSQSGQTILICKTKVFN
jgi:hypothetical protein